MMERLVHLLPDRLARRLARRTGLAVGILVGILLFSGVALAALVSPGALGINAARLSETRDLPEGFLGDGLDERDTDRDGLSDSLENYLYGTDPANWNTSGTGIPDGWLAQFGYDPLSPLIREARGAAPPADRLPAAYAGGYPIENTPLLADYYAFHEPADYTPGDDAPWWRDRPHADPSRWEAAEGIPTGWLVRHGIDPTDFEPDEIAPGSTSNLTLRDAFAHNANPLVSDSDRDGLDDWSEIRITQTDPARFSTGGTGIADGWLLHHGLDAADRRAGSEDPDRDGLTNLEEFIISYDTLRAEAEKDLKVLFGKGLDPREWETAGTGIPDGWYVKYGLSPFGADLDRLVGRASDYPGVRNLLDAPEGLEPLPDFSMTIKEAYEYGRPSDWDEATKGVWWGGTNPVTLDTDADGLPDPIEIRGWYANVTYDTGPETAEEVYVATSNPLEADSDGDGLSDLEEYEGSTTCGSETFRSFRPTDPRNRDTAFSGATDYEKVCGFVRGGVKYDFGADIEPGAPFLDPTKADSAGDYMRDGARLDFWHAAYDGYVNNPRYPYENSTYKTVFEWTEKHARFAGLSQEQVLAQFRPDGDVDGDGLANLLDADPSGGLFVAQHAPPGTAATQRYLLGGPQIDPELYKHTEFKSLIPHVASDPANPDTDGDGLPDYWEIQFGAFDPALGVWNLDPTRFDSNGDGISDAEANNDGDEITWYGYEDRGDRVERGPAQTFVFANGLEYLAGLQLNAPTDPNKLASTADGIPDGWKVFWNTRLSDETFPSLLSAADPRLGSYVLARASEIEEAMAASPIAPLSDLTGQGAKRTGYYQFPNSTFSGEKDNCAALLASLRIAPGEEQVPARCFQGENLQEVSLSIVAVKGVHTLTFAQEVSLRTNPFLADTDGDGAPDAWESYMLSRARARSPTAAHPEPALPDGTRDADGDGLTLADECDAARVAGGAMQCTRDTLELEDGTSLGAGSDPGQIDTDGDGIDDSLDINSLDPSDLEDFRDPNRHSDVDGIADYLELTGWGGGNPFPANVRTDPYDADTDNDGLLDGSDVTLTLPADAAAIETLRGQGIAHVRNGNQYTFRGESLGYYTAGSLPTDADSTRSGIPDGWLVYYNLEPDNGIPSAAYNHTRPTWWDEARHGIWWWGIDPTLTTAAPADLDGDGLHDTNGEDPFPYNFTNVIDPAGANIIDPRDVPAWIEAAPTPDEARRRAQSLGEGAGNPREARDDVHVSPNGVLVEDDRAPVKVIDLRIADVAGGSPILTKGVGFNVTGRVVLDARDGEGNLLQGSESDPIGVANRTVYLTFNGRDVTRLVGVGFTDPEGHFVFEGNMTSQLRVEIPHAGIGALQATRGIATATTDPGSIGAGDFTGEARNALTAWVLNTSATVGPGHPTYVSYQAYLRDANGVPAIRTTHATGEGASDAFPVTVRTGTQLTHALQTDVRNGETLVGDIILTDAAGGALVGRDITLRWTGSPETFERVITTNAAGRVNLTRLAIPASVEEADEHQLEAVFASSDPNLLGSEAKIAIRIRDPSNLTARLDRSAALVGDSLVVEGALATREVRLSDGRVLPPAPIADAEVVIDIGGLKQTATTDARGLFSLRVSVPGSVSAGAQTVTLTFEGDARAEPAAASLPLAIKRTAEIIGLNPLEGPRTGEVSLRGQIVDNEGQGFEGALTLTAAGMPIAEAIADSAGRFSMVVPLRTLPLGAQTLRVQFAGDDGHSAAENTTSARVTSTTTLKIERAPENVVRGSYFRLEARLADDRGGPVAAQPVTILWRGERLGTAVTDAQGRIAYDVPTNRSERATTTAVGLEYVPPPTSVYRASTAGATLDVLQGVQLELDSGSATRGSLLLRGRLLDDEDRPLAGSAVRLRFGELDLGEARTSRNGSFETAHALPPDFPLGTLTATATYAGTQTLNGATVNATWGVRSPLVLHLDVAGPFVRGEGARLEGRLVDDQGAPVDAILQARLGNVDLGALSTTQGALAATLQVPADMARGATTLWLNATGDERYDPLAREIPVLIKIRPKVEVDLPVFAIRGFAFGGDVRLLDDRGEPLANASFAYVIGPDASPVSGTTDAEGEGRVASVAPVTGDTFLALTVRAGPDVVKADYKTQTLKVIGPSTPIGYAGLVLGVLGILALAGLVVTVVVLRRRQLAEAREIIEEAIQDLLAGNEYAGTIFLAYRRLAAHLARYGYAEKASDTPREFAAGVRKALPVGPAPLRELIRLFEEARYSDHPIGSRERDQAVRSLRSVRDELDGILGSRPEAISA